MNMQMLTKKWPITALLLAILVVLTVKFAGMGNAGGGENETGRAGGYQRGDRYLREDGNGEGGSASAKVRERPEQASPSERMSREDYETLVSPAPEGSIFVSADTTLQDGEIAILGGHKNLSGSYEYTFLNHKSINDPELGEVYIISSKVTTYTQEGKEQMEFPDIAIGRDSLQSNTMIFDEADLQNYFRNAASIPNNHILTQPTVKTKPGEWAEITLMTNNGVYKLTKVKVIPGKDGKIRLLTRIEEGSGVPD